MSDDSVTTVTSQSWFSRLGDAAKGIILGFILFVIAFPVLWFNEGRAVQTARSLEEGAGIVVSVSADSVDAANEGKLIHLSGQALTNDVLLDEQFGISESAIKLRRSVEMYQWDETTTSDTKKKLGGGTETTTKYSYQKTWSSRAINSSGFQKTLGHENPGEIPLQEFERSAKRVSLGAFELSQSLIGRMSSYEALPVTAETLPADLSDKAQVYQGGYYLGGSPQQPQIGDMKVSYRVVKPGAISVVARQIGSTFEAYQAKAGKPVLLLTAGIQSAENMFQQAQAANTTMTWILRAIGFFLMFLGIKMMLKLLPVIGDVVPFIGSIVGAGTGIIAFLVAGLFASVTIALAWFAYRPLISVAILIVAGLCAFGLKRLKSKEAKAKSSA